MKLYGQSLERATRLKDNSDLPLAFSKHTVSTIESKIKWLEGMRLNSGYNRSSRQNHLNNQLRAGRNYGNFQWRGVVGTQEKIIQELWLKEKEIDPDYAKDVSSRMRKIHNYPNWPETLEGAKKLAAEMQARDDQREAVNNKVTAVKNAAAQDGEESYANQSQSRADQIAADPKMGRDEKLAALQKLLDDLETRAPVWKQLDSASQAIQKDPNKPYVTAALAAVRKIAFDGKMSPDQKWTAIQTVKNVAQTRAQLWPQVTQAEQQVQTALQTEQTQDGDHAQQQSTAVQQAPTDDPKARLDALQAILKKLQDAGLRQGTTHLPPAPQAAGGVGAPAGQVPGHRGPGNQGPQRPGHLRRACPDSGRRGQARWREA
jgi:hypothetical protein